MSAAKNITITALVPTYNRAHYLAECLDSLLQQSYPPAQVIVVSDGCTDNTAKIVKSYGNKVQFLEKENGGKSSAINLGLKHCTSDFIWICDDDDVADLKGLESLTALLNASPDANIAIGKTQEFYEKDGVKHHIPRGELLRQGESDIHLNFLEKMRTGVFAMLVKKDLYDRVGPYNPEFIRSQDYEMTLRLMRNANIVETDHVIYYYRQHNETRGSAEQKTKARDMQKRWLDYNQRIFKQVEATYTFGEFTPSFAKNLSADLQKRATHIQRAVIFINHGLWAHCANEYTNAAQIMPQTPLSKNERTLAASAGVNEITLEELWTSQDTIKLLKKGYTLNNNAAALLQHLTPSFGYMAIKKLIVERDADLLKTTYKNLSKIMGAYSALAIFARGLALCFKGHSPLKKLKAIIAS